ncbi:MAG TPA: hypothetical protein VLG40_00080 [Candidatus Saccharimonas sp.]|nr:hypothetical protein [Candidatus Saccharimonas sp.]
MKYVIPAAIAAIALMSGCSGQTTTANPPSSSAVPTSSAAPSSTSAMPYYNPTLNADEKAAFEYYESPERRARFQQLMDTLGKQLLTDFVGRGVKLDTTGWDKKKPAPANGYGSIITHDKSSSGIIAQLQVMFKDGKPDVTVSPIGLFLQKDGTVYMTNTVSLDNFANPIVPSGSDDYSWAILSPAQTHDVHLMPADGSKIDLNSPLQGDYRVFGTNGTQDPQLTVDGIKAADNDFFGQIAAFNVTSSDWR